MSPRSRPPRTRIQRLKAEEVFEDLRHQLRVMRVPSQGAGQVPHAHEFEELVVIVGGRATHRVGNEEYELGVGEVFVVLPSMSHCYPRTEGLSLINILYDPTRLRLPNSDLGALPGYQALFEVEPRLRQRERFKNRLKLSMEDLGQFLNIVAEAERELAQRELGCHYMATAHFMRMIGFLSRAYTDKIPPVARPVTQISKVLGHLERHYAEPLTIRDLANVAGMSPTSLFRTFRAIMDRPPLDYLIRMRIDKARHLLRSGGQRVSEVSAAVGFNDSNYFTRQFRRITGQTPREAMRPDRADLAVRRA